MWREGHLAVDPPASDNKAADHWEIYHQAADHWEIYHQAADHREADALTVNKTAGFFDWLRSYQLCSSQLISDRNSRIN